MESLFFGLKSIKQRSIKRGSQELFLQNEQNLVQQTVLNTVLNTDF